MYNNIVLDYILSAKVISLRGKYNCLDIEFSICSQLFSNSYL